MFDAREWERDLAERVSAQICGKNCELCRILRGLLALAFVPAIRKTWRDLEVVDSCAVKRPTSVYSAMSLPCLFSSPERIIPGVGGIC